MAVTWDPTMATGVPSVDEQHKELFRQVAALSDAMSQGRGRDEIKPILQFLADYVVKHFAEEEAYMEQHHCPVAAANKAAHRDFLQQLKLFQERFNTQGVGPSLVLDLHDVVSQWLVKHIHGIDKQLSSSVGGQTA